MRVLITDRAMWLEKVDQLIGYYTAKRKEGVRAFFEERRHGALSWLRKQCGRPTRPRTDEEIKAQMDFAEGLDLRAAQLKHAKRLERLQAIKHALLTKGTGDIWLEVEDLWAVQ